MSRGRRGGGLSAAPAGPARPRGWGEARRIALDNGLTVVTAPAPGLHSAMVALYVRAGSRHEAASENGVSHFLEHLLFNERNLSPKFIAVQSRRLLGDLLGERTVTTAALPRADRSEDPTECS